MNSVLEERVAIELLTQPGSSTMALLDAIERARNSIHIVVFRFDQREIEVALRRAAKRGVFVHALVANTSAGQGGAITLRKLEMRLLAEGITVTRTASDLVRYHNKLMIVDGTTLFLLSFNFTHLDIDRSRSFGIATQQADWVAEALRLFHCDATRQSYVPECDSFVVSPVNSRQRLLGLLANANRSVLIYDDKLSDPAAMRILAAKAREGIDVRVIGSVGRRATGVLFGKLNIRLHCQVIIQDGVRLFLGSQSLRSVELDARRETGIITTDREIVRQVSEVFESDWLAINGTKVAATEGVSVPFEHAVPVDDLVRAEPPPLSPSITADLLKCAVREAIVDAICDTLHPSAASVPLKETVKEAAREALQSLAEL